MSLRPLARWTPGEPITARKLNVPLEFSLFELTGRSPVMVTRTGRNSAVVGLEWMFPGARGGVESIGEFQWQNRLMVAPQQPGWDDDRLTAVLEDETP